jgi:putative transcriptional regulator
MKASYKKLWKLLVDKDMSKGDLHKASGLSSSTMTKLRKGEDVSMEALRKICICLDCNIGDIVEFVDESKSKSPLYVTANMVG